VLFAEKALFVWDGVAPEPLRRLDGHVNLVRQLGFLPGAGHPRRAFSFDGAELRIWEDVETSDEVRKVPIPGTVVALTPEADAAYVGDSGGNLTHWYELGGGRPKSWTFNHLHTRGITAMALAPDGKALFTAGADERLIWWDLTVQPIKAVHEWEIRGGVGALLFAPDGRHLITGNGNSTIYVLRLPGK
jgi:WD40 repeat protein